MKTDKNTSVFGEFLGSSNEYPVLAAVAAGLYPMLFYYSNNFTLINSWGHLGYFISIFVLIPVFVFFSVHWILKKFSFGKWAKYILPFLNVFVFLFLLELSLFADVQKKITLAILIIAGLVAFFLFKHFKKWMIIQLLLALIGLFTLAPVIYGNLTVSKNWMTQPDAIEQVIFKKKPNIYYIQPDGYVNFSELKKGYYQFDNSEFEGFLENEGFKNYPNFRSNYDATLASNSATFMMKHHLYLGASRQNEVAHARKNIVSENSVLKVFKNNGYKTFLFTEHPYLMMNRPEMGFDACNFSYSEIPFIGSGMETKRDILKDLKAHFEIPKTENPKFLFIEIFEPKHINSIDVGENAVAKKRRLYIENLQTANAQLKEVIKLIKENDPHSLIVIMADHGGYVGMTNLREGNKKTQDRDKLYSIFSSILAIHWPDGSAPEFDNQLHTSVNVFRVLFSFLSEDKSYLEHLQKDSSYGLIFEGAPNGVYEVIDENGIPGFEGVRLFGK